MQHLKIDGRGDPNTSPAFAEAVRALYPVAYKLKFASKRDLVSDYVVPPLESLWWAEDMEAFTTARDKSRWDWTVMLMVPDWIDRTMFASPPSKPGPRTHQRVSTTSASRSCARGGVYRHCTSDSRIRRLSPRAHVCLASPRRGTDVQ